MRDVYCGASFSPEASADSSKSCLIRTDTIASKDSIEVHRELLQIGDIIVVKTGQKSPVDGVVLEKDDESVSWWLFRGVEAFKG